MIDVAALWVGRVVLGLAALTVALTIVGMFSIGFQVVRKGARDAWETTRKAKTIKKVE